MKPQFVSILFSAGEEGQVQKNGNAKSGLSYQLQETSCAARKQLKGFSEEKAFVCFALAVHKASERIHYKDHQSFFFIYFETKSKKKEKWYGNVIMNDYIQNGVFKKSGKSS